jgi:hypothetical protein
MPATDWNEKGSNTSYYRVGNKKATSRAALYVFSKEKTENPAEFEYTTTAGTLYHITPKKEIIGYLKEVKFDIEGEYASLNITILDSLNPESNRHIVNMSLNSSFARSFFEKMGNLEAGKLLTFRPYEFEDKKTNPPKKQKGVTLIQAGEKLENYFGATKNEKGVWVQLRGTPPLVKKIDPLKGTVSYDGTDALVFYKNYVEGELKNKLDTYWNGGVSSSYAQQKNASKAEFVQANSQQEQSINDDDEDLPF